MITKRYVALNLISLGMAVAGLAALLTPAPLRGPQLQSFLPPAQTTSLGLLGLSRPFYWTDALGLSCLACAMLSVWVIAIVWEHRRQRRQHLWQSR